MNRYLWQDKPVVITYPTPEELETLDYRSKKALTGQVRIVTFPGADVCACCGTHVSSAGQIGLVKLVSVQKFREGVRIELLCGGRALDYLSRMEGQNKAVSNLLSAKPGETAQGVQRLLEENAALKSRILTMEEQHFAALGPRLRRGGERGPVRGRPVSRCPAAAVRRGAGRVPGPVRLLLRQRRGGV